MTQQTTKVLFGDSIRIIDIKTRDNNVFDVKMMVRPPKPLEFVKLDFSLSAHKPKPSQLAFDF